MIYDWPQNVRVFADAIAKAEGSNPDWNNPGDMTINSLNLPVTGVANSEGVLKFQSYDDGYNTLCHQCSIMLNGKSKVYMLGMTLEQAGQLYAHGDGNWAINVGKFLGVPVTITLSELAVKLSPSVVTDPEIGL